MAHKKLYYVPGLISALVLPLLLIYFDKNRPVEKNTLHLFVPSDVNVPDSVPRFERWYVQQFLKDKRKHVVALENTYIYNELTSFVDNSNREFIVDEMRKLRFTYDTTMVLEVRLLYENTYGDFVWFINMATLFNIKRYVWIDNSIYFIPNPPPQYEEPLAVEPIEAYIDPEFKRPTGWDIFWWDVKNWFAMIWYYLHIHYITITAFVLLVVFPSLYCLRRRKIAARLIST